jgi:hypothetical protein
MILFYSKILFVILLFQYVKIPTIITLASKFHPIRQIKQVMAGYNEHNVFSQGSFFFTTTNKIKNLNIFLFFLNFEIRKCFNRTKIIVHIF